LGKGKAVVSRRRRRREERKIGREEGEKCSGGRGGMVGGEEGTKI